MADPAGFAALQYAFAGHIRDPEHMPVPDGVEPRRMAVYRDLFYNNVENFIANSFPVLRAITPDERWHALVRDYFSRHRARTPLFHHMPREFLRYLEQERNVGDDPPFLRELAHYEWMEMAAAFDPREIDWRGVDLSRDLLAGVPVLSPLAFPLCYRYPVHTIGPANQPASPPDQPTYLVIYRDRHYRVGFLELNPVAARLVELIRNETGSSGRELLAQIAVELKHPDPGTVTSAGLDIMQGLQGKDILLGVRRTSARD